MFKNNYVWNTFLSLNIIPIVLFIKNSETRFLIVSRTKLIKSI